MGKFHQIAKGKRARKMFELPLLDGEIVAVAIVPLFGEDEAIVLSNARAFARTHGVEDPKPGEPLYERGLALHTVLRTVMDHDVVEKNDPFFRNAEEILQHLDPGRIALLFNMQRAWQAVCAPKPEKMNEIEFIKHVLELADAAEAEERGEGAREVPFDTLPLNIQLKSARLLAARYVTLASLKSLFGSATPADEKSSSDSSPLSPEAQPPEQQTSTPPMFSPPQDELPEEEPSAVEEAPELDPEAIAPGADPAPEDRR